MISTLIQTFVASVAMRRAAAHRRGARRRRRGRARARDDPDARSRSGAHHARAAEERRRSRSSSSSPTSSRAPRRPTSRRRTTCCRGASSAACSAATPRPRRARHQLARRAAADPVHRLRAEDPRPAGAAARQLRDQLDLGRHLLLASAATSAARFGRARSTSRRRTSRSSCAARRWYLNIGLQRLWDNVRDPYRTFFSTMALTGERLAVLGLRRRRRRRSTARRSGRPSSSARYDLYENKVQRTTTCSCSRR